MGPRHVGAPWEKYLEGRRGEGGRERKKERKKKRKKKEKEKRHWKNRKGIYLLRQSLYAINVQSKTSLLFNDRLYGQYDKVL